MKDFDDNFKEIDVNYFELCKSELKTTGLVWAYSTIVGRRNTLDKYYKYWRTTNEIMAKRIRDEIIKCDTLLGTINWNWDISESHRDLNQRVYQLLRVKTGQFKPELDNEAAELSEKMAENVAFSRRKKLVQDISYEISWGLRNMYGLFWTLTFDDPHLFSTMKEIEPNMFGEKRYSVEYNDDAIETIWKSFLTRLKRRLGKDIRYICVPEFGSNTGRFHLHMILFSEEPIDCKDPNLRVLNGFNTKITIDEYEELWNAGFNEARPIINKESKWYQEQNGDQGWKRPVDEKGNLLDYSTGQLQGYLTKYLTKSIQENYQCKNELMYHNPDQWNTTERRVKKTRLYGISKLPSMKSLTSEELAMLARLTTGTQDQHPIAQTIKRGAKRELKMRLELGENTLNNYIGGTWKSEKSYHGHYQGMMRKTYDPNLQSLGDILTEPIASADISENWPNCQAYLDQCEDLVIDKFKEVCNVKGD